MNINIFYSDAPTGHLAEIMRWCWGAKSVPKGIWASNDSILLIPRWYALCVAPRSVAMQLETHKKKDGFYLWMQSARPDIGKTEFVAGYSREQPVRFAMTFTAASVKTISHFRMCNKAEKPTRDFMFLWRDKMSEICPLLAKEMVPLCVFRNGKCTELHSCRGGANGN